MKRLPLFVFFTFMLVSLHHAQELDQDRLGYEDLKRAHLQAKYSARAASSYYVRAGEHFIQEGRYRSSKASKVKFLTLAVQAYNSADSCYDASGYVDKAKEARMIKEQIEAEIREIKGEKEPEPEPEKKAETVKIPAPGNRLSNRIEFAARFGVFTIQLPASLGEITPKRSNTEMLTTSVELNPSPITIGLRETAFSAIPGYAESAKQSGSENFCEKQSFMFVGADMNDFLRKKGVELEPDKKREMQAQTYEMSSEEINIGPTSACLITIGGKSRDDDKIMVVLRFFYKNNLYDMGFEGPTAWKNILLRSAKTFRIKQVPIPEGGIECYGKEAKLMESKALINTFQIPAQKSTQEFKFVVSPVLPRNPVPKESWAKIISGIKLALDNAPRTQMAIKVKSPDRLDDIRDMMDQSFQRSNMVVEYAKQYSIECVMQTLTDMDGPTYIKAIKFYLDAMESCINGISGLESKISNMSANVYWQVPYTTIKAKCIPRMTCYKGKWDPDYYYAESREISRSEGLERSDRRFLTPRQVEREKERVAAYIEKLERNLSALESNADRSLCDKALQRFSDRDFWKQTETCARIERKLDGLYQQKNLLQPEIVLFQEVWDSYRTEKTGRIRSLSSQLTTLRSEKRRLKAELDKVEGQIERRKKNANNENPETYKAGMIVLNRKYRKLFEELQFTDSQIASSQKLLDYYQNPKTSSSIENNLTGMKDQMANLDSQIKDQELMQSRAGCKRK
ncbi:MAG: hypothetical protein AAFY71_21210 [Bacteroidota bacterium]